MKAEIAWRLGKRYAQDEPLDWGAAVDRSPEDLHAAARGRPYITQIGEWRMSECR